MQATIIQPSAFHPMTKPRDIVCSLDCKLSYFLSTEPLNGVKVAVGMRFHHRDTDGTEIIIVRYGLVVDEALCPLLTDR